MLRFDSPGMKGFRQSCSDLLASRVLESAAAPLAGKHGVELQSLYLG